ncbi:MAG: hypothetical protein F7C07_01735 [Desulfurococcales archaeon]|nr:hypothetical protein [Desulfurococcales archaeon]
MAKRRGCAGILAVDEFIRPRLALLGLAGVHKLLHGVSLAVESFRERRKKAGILLSYAGEARTIQGTREALKVYRAWLDGKISYRKALKLIKQIANSGK